MRIKRWDREPSTNQGLVKGTPPTTAPCHRGSRSKADSKAAWLEPQHAGQKKTVQEEDLEAGKHLTFARAYHPDKASAHPTEEPAQVRTNSDMVNGTRVKQILEKEMALWF